MDAFSRLSGARETKINLADGLILADTDPAEPVSPSTFWREVRRVGFTPERMEVWAKGLLGEAAFVTGNARWPLVKPGPAEKNLRRIHLRVAEGSEDPPRVEVVE